MPGDTGDWATTPPSELGAFSGAGLYLNGGPSPLTGVNAIAISHVVPAGKTFYIFGASIGHVAVANAFSVWASITDNATLITYLVAQYGHAFSFATPVPVSAGHTVQLVIQYNGAAGPDQLVASIWGVEQ